MIRNGTLLEPDRFVRLCLVGLYPWGEKEVERYAKYPRRNSMTYNTQQFTYPNLRFYKTCPALVVNIIEVSIIDVILLITLAQSKPLLFHPLMLIDTITKD